LKEDELSFPYPTNDDEGFGSIPFQNHKIIIILKNILIIIIILFLIIPSSFHHATQEVSVCDVVPSPHIAMITRSQRD
jgi:hypothetical protein